MLPILYKFLPGYILIHCLNRFHLRWGCREILYDKSADGSIYVTGLAMSKVIYFVLFSEVSTCFFSIVLSNIPKVKLLNCGSIGPLQWNNNGYSPDN